MELKGDVRMVEVEAPKDGPAFIVTSAGLLVLDYAGGKPVNGWLLRQEKD